MARLTVCYACAAAVWLGLAWVTCADGAQRGTGLRFGLSVASLGGDTQRLAESLGQDDLGHRYGIAGGFFTVVGNERFAFQGELNLTMKGATLANALASEIDVIFKLAYVEASALGKLLIPVEGSVQPGLLFGLTGGAALRRSLCAKLMDEEECENINQLFTSLDYGLTVGADLVFARKSTSIVLDVRYTFGIRNVAEGGVLELRNQTLLISLGLLFPFKETPQEPPERAAAEKKAGLLHPTPTSAANHSKTAS